MPISFQIHGFNIRFYLTELKHETMYTMTEIAHLQVPDSLDTISGLLSKITLSRQNQGEQNEWLEYT
ncbi:predicted protein [Lichtheimia corymbifera JMRC:FSU:9682]|uniref:Uncharacterized protein n=1 Tax=Lichtheimia corymbifera JMRC:FSU:9682 TaxID=1263082 RepID=A0A068RFU8_9FUNG|nr:predicted protein [Lichtheimia corymbifera JMRC:FSU:9682]